MAAMAQPPMASTSRLGSSAGAAVNQHYHPRPSPSIDPTIEPDDEWKFQLRIKIRDNLEDLKESAQDDMKEELRKDPSRAGNEAARAKYLAQINDIGKMADETFLYELQQERWRRQAERHSANGADNADPTASALPTRRDLNAVQQQRPRSITSEGKTDTAKQHTPSDRPSPAPSPRIPTPGSTYAQRPTEAPSSMVSRAPEERPIPEHQTYPFPSNKSPGPSTDLPPPAYTSDTTRTPPPKTPLPININSGVQSSNPRSSLESSPKKPGRSNSANVATNVNSIAKAELHPPIRSATIPNPNSSTGANLRSDLVPEDSGYFSPEHSFTTSKRGHRQEPSTGGKMKTGGQIQPHTAPSSRRHSQSRRPQPLDIVDDDARNEVESPSSSGTESDEEDDSDSEEADAPHSPPAYTNTTPSTPPPRSLPSSPRKQQQQHQATSPRPPPPPSPKKQGPPPANLRNFPPDSYDSPASRRGPPIPASPHEIWHPGPEPPPFVPNNVGESDSQSSPSRRPSLHHRSSTQGSGGYDSHPHQRMRRTSTGESRTGTVRIKDKSAASNSRPPSDTPPTSARGPPPAPFQHQQQHLSSRSSFDADEHERNNAHLWHGPSRSPTDSRGSPLSKTFLERDQSQRLPPAHHSHHHVTRRPSRQDFGGPPDSPNPSVYSAGDRRGGTSKAGSIRSRKSIQDIQAQPPATWGVMSRSHHRGSMRGRGRSTTVGFRGSRKQQGMEHHHRGTSTRPQQYQDSSDADDRSSDEEHSQQGSNDDDVSSNHEDDEDPEEEEESEASSSDGDDELDGDEAILVKYLQKHRMPPLPTNMDDVFIMRDRLKRAPDIPPDVRLAVKRWSNAIKRDPSRLAQPGSWKDAPTMRTNDTSRKVSNDAHGREEALRLREEELRKREEALAKQEEEAKRQAEWRRREEELRERERQLQQREEETKKREEEARKRDEEARKREEEAKAKEKAAKKRADEARRKEREAKEQAEEAARQAEEIARQAEEARRKEENAKQMEEEAHQAREAALKMREEEEARLEALRREEVQRKAEEMKRMAEEERQRASVRNFEEDEVRRAKEQMERQRQEEADVRRRSEELRRQHEEDRAKAEQQRRYRQAQEEARKQEQQKKAPEKESTRRASTTTDRSFPSSYGAAGSSHSEAYASSVSSSASSSRSTPLHRGSTPGTGASTPSGSQRKSATPTAAHPSATKSTHSTAQHEAEAHERWKRRQEDQAREREEAFRRSQQQEQAKRQQRSTPSMTKEQFLALVKSHDYQWTRLKGPDAKSLKWEDFPWPVLPWPNSADDISNSSVAAYVLAPHFSQDKSAKARIKEYLLRWHPDRVAADILVKVEEAEGDKVRAGVNAVAGALNELYKMPSGN